MWLLNIVKYVKLIVHIQLHYNPKKNTNKVALASQATGRIQIIYQPSITLSSSIRATLESHIT